MRTARDVPTSISVPAMPYCLCGMIKLARNLKISITGTYAYPNKGTSQCAGWSFAFGPSASFFASGSSLSVGASYGLFASFSSDMVEVFLLMSYAFRNESGLVYLSLKNKGFTILLA